MILHRRIKQYKSGVTLIEQVVALALLSLFSLAASIILAPLFNSSRRLSNAIDAEMLITNVAGAVQSEIAYADELAVEPDRVVADGKVISLSAEGYLLIGGELKYPAAYYGGNTLSMRFSMADETVRIELSVDYEGSRACSLTAVAVPIKSLLN